MKTSIATTCGNNGSCVNSEKLLLFKIEQQEYEQAFLAVSFLFY
jgi:hypothetical protein